MAMRRNKAGHASPVPDLIHLSIPSTCEVFPLKDLAAQICMTSIHPSVNDGNSHTFPLRLGPGIFH